MIEATWVLWNFFLASIPVAAAYLLAWGVEKERPGRRVLWLAWIPLAALWLAFLPNTCYLLTEWRHFLFDSAWYDLIGAARYDDFQKLNVARWALFFGFYSGFGVITFVLAIRPMERLLRGFRWPLLPLAVPFYFLMSLGVYLGLMERLNSWQVLTHPAEVWQSIQTALASPLVLATILAFAVFLWVMYEAVDLWVDGLVLRLRPRQILREEPNVVAEALRVAKGEE